MPFEIPLYFAQRNTLKKGTMNKTESESYKKIEFHETVHENGMARMVGYETLIIPAHGRTRLERVAARISCCST